MSNFDKDTMAQVWKKGEITSGTDKNVFRKDQCGAWISLSEYGNRDSIYGWEIDHIEADANGGSDSIYNLRPLHWKNNLETSDGRLKCPIKSSGNKNIGF